MGRGGPGRGAGTRARGPRPGRRGQGREGGIDGLAAARLAPGAGAGLEIRLVPDGGVDEDADETGGEGGEEGGLAAPGARG